MNGLKGVGRLRRVAVNEDGEVLDRAQPPSTDETVGIIGERPKAFFLIGGVVGSLRVEHQFGLDSASRRALSSSLARVISALEGT